MPWDASLRSSVAPYTPSPLPIQSSSLPITALVTLHATASLLVLGDLSCLNCLDVLVGIHHSDNGVRYHKAALPQSLVSD